MLALTVQSDRSGVVHQQELSMTVDVDIPSEVKRSAPRPVPSTTDSPRSGRKERRRYALFRQWDYAKSDKQGQGIRSKRREDDLRELLSWVDGLDEVDIVEPTCSAFTTLFMEHDKMRVWNNFLNQSEEEQNELLHPEDTEDNEESDDNDFEKVDCAEIVDENDGRETHPAFSAEECYGRISSKLRAFLNKRVPMGTVQHLEDDLIAFFNEDPTSVLITKLGSSFERMILHALCQYLDLSSRSFSEVPGGGRHTQVENKQLSFTPPQITLTQYLEIMEH